MPYTTVVNSTTITSAWANTNVRDQVVTPFASSSARAAAITAPVEGMVSYLQDVDRIDAYDGSAWQPVSYVPGFLFARKTADETLNTNTTLQNDDHLVVSVLANAVYTLDGWIVVGSTSETPDIKMGWTLPASATISFSARGLISGVTATTADKIETVSKMYQTSPSAVIAAGLVNDTHSITLKGLVVTGGTAGNLQFQWAQLTSNATDITVKKDSWIKLQRVG